VDLDDVLAGGFALVLPHLTERQRRLLLGGFARVLGHGGVTRVAELAGSTRPTVRRGMAEADPGLLAALDALVDPVTRGDPESPLRWTTRSTRQLADALTAQGHRVSHTTVAGLLRAQGYSLQGTRKTLEGAQHPDRDAQFGYINDQATAYLAAGQPVISVDAKKKELVGQFANTGVEWQPSGEPERVNVHDFPDPELGKAIPYGVYDVGGNTGWVSVGVD
jgi:hypothetical protein